MCDAGSIVLLRTVDTFVDDCSNVLRRAEHEAILTNSVRR